MGQAYWFLVEFKNGRPEIVSELYESLEEAKEHWDGSTTICETVFG